MIGLYGQANYNNSNQYDYPQVAGWPAGLVPISIHTVRDDTDYVGFFFFFFFKFYQPSNC